MVSLLPNEKRGFFRSVYPQLEKDCIEEWTHDTRYPPQDLGPSEHERQLCSLCNHKIRWVFHIVNKRNQNTLVVGSECVKHFGFGMTTADIREMLKNATRLRRLYQLNQVIPDIRNIVQDWAAAVEKQPILIPSAVEKEYLQAGEQAQILYENYLNGSDVAVEELKVLVGKQGTQLRGITDYVRQNSTRRFVPKKAVVQWATREGLSEVIQLLKEDGEIRWRTIHRIREPVFVNGIIPDFNIHLKTIGITITAFDSERRGFVHHLVKRQRCRLLCDYGGFMLKYGGLVFAEPLRAPLDLRSILDMSKLYDRDALEEIGFLLGGLLKGQGIELYGHDSEYNEALVIYREEGQFAVVNLEEIASKFHVSILTASAEGLDKILAELGSHSHSRYPLSQLRDNDRYVAMRRQY